MHSIERQILNHVLDCSHDDLKRCRDQLPQLQVKDRKVGDGMFIVDFIVSEKPNIPKYKRQKNMPKSFVITDGRMKIKESSEEIGINLFIENNQLSSLVLSGNFDFNNPFSIAELYWCKAVSLWPNKIVHKRTDKRDLNSAIGYYPLYK